VHPLCLRSWYGQRGISFLKAGKGGIVEEIIKEFLERAPVVGGLAFTLAFATAPAFGARGGINPVGLNRTNDVTNRDLLRRLSQEIAAVHTSYASYKPGFA